MGQAGPQQWQQTSPQMNDVLAALAQSALTTANAMQQMGGAMADQQTKRESNQGYRALKPKRDVTHIKGIDAATLMNEIYSFETDLMELGVTILGESAFFQLRSVTNGAARDVLDFALLREPMFGLHNRGMAADQGDKFYANGAQGRGYDRAVIFEQLYLLAINELKCSVNLPEERRW